MDERAPTLPPDVFESVVKILAATLVRDYRERWAGRAAAQRLAADLDGPRRVVASCRGGGWRFDVAQSFWSKYPGDLQQHGTG